MEPNKYKVCVRCMTFNHAPYIVDAMNGFTMQQTDFPFVCTIIDDASTDGEQEVIRKYLEEHFDLQDSATVRNDETDDYFLTFARHKTNTNCYFAVLFLKYNHYSIKKPKLPYLSEWNDHAKYIALCEGDDYWISSEKLQKQVECLENHPDFTMVCNRTRLYSVKRDKYIGENYCYNQSRIVDAKDVINRTGLFISTCSIVYRKEISDNIPDYWRKCKVGDYPLQIMCAMRGNVYYQNEVMSVYRVENTSSWMGQQKWSSVSKDRLEVIRSQIEMFKGFSNQFPTYRKDFDSKIADHINRNVPSWRSQKEDIQNFLDYFPLEIKKYPIRWKFDLWIRKLRIPKIRVWYTKVFLRDYSQRKLIY